VYRKTEAVFIYDFKAFPRMTQFCFKLNIRVGHCPCRYYALVTLLTQSAFKEFGSVALDFYILEIMVDLIAFAPTVAVYTAVRAASKHVHVVMSG
jgi:hypothetical protein